MTVRGEGLLLRPPTLEDRPRLLELLRDPVQVALGSPVFVPVPDGVDDLDERVAAAAAAYEAGLPGMLVAAEEDDPDRLLGDVSWRCSAHPAMRIADLGYAVHPDARGRRVATRSVRLVTRWLLLDADGPHQARVQLDHSTENEASCRTALAAGFAREGVRRGFLPLRDTDAPQGSRRHDVCLHGVLGSDLTA